MFKKLFMKNFTKIFFIVLLGLLTSGYGIAQQIQLSALKQIQSLAQEKENRTPAQKKMDSQVWYALKMERGQAITSDVATLQVQVYKGTDGKVPEILKVVSPRHLYRQLIMQAEILFSVQKNLIQLMLVCLC